MVAKLEADGYDGVDLDFEFPWGGEEPTFHFNVVKAVYEKVKANNPEHVVMFGVSPGYLIGEYAWDQLGDYSDYAFYFCYDWKDPALGPMTNPNGGPYSAFGGVTLSEHSCRGALDYVLAQGYPAEKLVVGFGFYSSGGQAWMNAPAGANDVAPDPDYMEAFVSGAWWMTPAAFALKIDAVMNPAKSVLSGGVTVGGIGWWMWGHEDPASPDLSQTAKAKMAAY